MRVFKVINKGILSSVQNYGNYSNRSEGIAISGALDEHSYLWGNYLLGNNFNTSSLEITIGQTELIALNGTKIAITGANLNCTINAKLAPLWSVITINKGDILKWYKPINGVRAYLSITSGFKNSPNQQLTNSKILLANNTCVKNKIKKIPRKFIPNYSEHLTLRILTNNESNFWTKQDFKLLFSSVFKISLNNNRIAYKLTTQNIKPKTNKMISEANNYGSMQITPNGEPIIMLKDAPTIGGYAKIGNIFSLDLAKLAQKTSNDYLSFTAISIYEAQKLKREFNSFFNI